MRMRNPKDKDEILDSCDFYFDLENKFDNDNPVHLEIGMGKGDFLLGMAKEYPDINFIGVEKYSSVGCVAIKKIKEENLSNVKVLIGDIVSFSDLLKNYVNLVYLNFSDPWPKDRHSKRRLTHENQLKVYDNFFKNEKEIIMKTDNDDLFAFSLDSFKDYGYKVIDICYDLHATNKKNIKTEYENKFSNKGFKIKFVHVKKED